jgi:hypothetical protein
MLRVAARDYSTSRWQIGDLLNHGEAAGYGKTYDETVAETGLSQQRIANLKWLAGAVEISRRRESLSLGHHMEIAALPPAQQDRLLELAANAGWSRAILREEAAKVKTDPADEPQTTTIYVRRIDTPPAKPVFISRTGAAIRTADVPAPPQPAIRITGCETDASRPHIQTSDADTTRGPLIRYVFRETGLDEEPTSAMDELVAVQGRLADCEERLVLIERRHPDAIDGTAAAHVREARAEIERRISAMKTETVPEQQPDRHQLH